jgi:hypothetical protein
MQQIKGIAASVHGTKTKCESGIRCPVFHVKNSERKLMDVINSTKWKYDRFRINKLAK